MKMIFDWFDAKESKAFGESLAIFYMSRVKTEDGTRGSKFTERKNRQLLEKLTQQIIVFRTKNKLNIYKKAQLSNVFKWRMLDAGFDTSYVDELTNWVTQHL